MPRGNRANKQAPAAEQQASTNAPPGFEAFVNAPVFVPASLASVNAPPPGFATPQPLLQNHYGAPPPGLEQRFKPPNQQSSSTDVSARQNQSSSVPTQVLQQSKPKHHNKKPRQRVESNNSQQQQSGNQQHEPREAKGSMEECILCCRRSDVFGIGNCRHPACMECIIRMRCLGESKKCHACREEIETIYFVKKPLKRNDYVIPTSYLTNHPDCAKFNIAFESQQIADQYDKLNAFTCSVCQNVQSFADYSNFAALKNHMASQHNLFFCHICLDHLNILPKYRQSFKKAELELHMTGKSNKVKGVRGHPKCDFCNQRYFDAEELYKHSRKEHYFCQICSDESGTNQFFKYADALHKHYRLKHHPCLHADCVDAGIVFSDEFALNLHKSQQHGGTDRKVPIDFQFTRNHSRFGEAPSRLASQGHGVSVIPSNQPPVQQPATIIPSAQLSGQPVNLVQRPPIVQQHDFPSLASAEAPNAYNQGSNWRASVISARNQVSQEAPKPSLKQQINSTTHFPSLGASSSTNPAQNSVWGSGKAIEIMKNPPKPKPPSAKPARKKIIPLPGVWTEEMQKKLEAREKGLPMEEEEVDPILQLSLAEEKPKKPKKPKKKTIGLETLKMKLNDQSTLTSQSTATKFSALRDME